VQAEEDEEEEKEEPRQEGIATMRRQALRVVALAAFALALVVSPAQAIEPIESFSSEISDPQAGGHPDIQTSFRLADPGAPEAAREVVFNMAEGFFGNPSAITRCTSLDFALDSCPSAAQAGLITVRAKSGGDPDKLLGTAPIYNLVPQNEDQTARFAFVLPTLGIPINIPIAARTGGDYGLRFTVSGISQVTPLAAADLTFWGYPALAEHDAQRFPKGTPGSPPGCAGVEDTSCLSGPTQAAITVRPLIDNPSLCAGDLETSLEVETYQDPGKVSRETATVPPITGCRRPSFQPVIHVNPTTDETDSPTGLDIELQARQELDATITPSQIRSAFISLPDGLTINPDAADGQTACSDEQARFGTELPTACPDSSKIGTFVLGTPALDGPLPGSVYIGEPRPNDQYRLILAADGFGLHAKLVGSIKPDPNTGALTVELSDLPQVPFETINVHLFASDRGLLATPIQCTLHESRARFVAWNDLLPEQRVERLGFGLSSGPGGSLCPGQTRPFHPRLVAGTSNPVAGAFSDFHLRLNRDDGDQFLGDLNFKMPPGFTGDLSGISYCPESGIAAAAANRGTAERLDASCPAASQIGTTNVAAGPGAHPFYAYGQMYLAGPFKGAPLSLVAVTPALAGPYDYGVVVVRVALHIDPLTAQVKAESDTVPSIIGGVPIRLRSIQVNIDRPNFTINPTNCSPFSVDSEGIGDQGTVASFSSPFTALNCATLPFKPKMKITQLGGKSQTRRAKDPELRFNLRTRTGDANIKSLRVTLPTAFAIDQRHLGNICAEKELAENECAGRAPIGAATTRTPLLDQPLAGPVYAVSGSGGLPRLAFLLNGQVKLLPRAETKTDSKVRLQTTVPVVPDAPIGEFELTIFGGKRGYLNNTRDICKAQPVTRVDYTAQNGKTFTQKVKVALPCKKQRGKRKSR
jgi:hypothetical protein